MSKVQIIILLSIVFQINSCKNKNGYEQFIDNLKIGYKFGQFSHTRKKFEYKKVKKT